MRKKLHEIQSSRGENSTGRSYLVSNMTPNVYFEEPSSATPPAAKHSSTVFLTMCVGHVHFQFHCAPFLASFERAYKGAAKDHLMVFFFAEVNATKIQYASSRFAPWVHFEKLPDLLNMKPMEGVDMECPKESPDGLMTERFQDNKDMNTATQNAVFPQIVGKYLQKHKHLFCHAVIIDSDTLFVRPLGGYLDHCDVNLGKSETPQFREAIEWDVAFTTYDPDFRVPWANDAEHVGRTRSGLSRINAGMMLLSLRNHSIIHSFLDMWWRATLLFVEAYYASDAPGMPKALDWLLQEFKGPNQAGLALVLSARKPETLLTLLNWGDKCQLCKEAVQFWISDDEGPLSLNIQAFPARILNHAESMIDGKFPVDLLVVHLKGSWWRAILTKGGSGFQTPTRSPRWNRDALMLHGSCLDVWELGWSSAQN